MNFSSKCFLSNAEEINSLHSFLKKSKKYQITKIANNQLNQLCGIIYKIAMRAGDGERRINYDWPNQLSWLEIKENVLILQQIPSQRKFLKWNGQIQIQNQPY